MKVFQIAYNNIPKDIKKCMKSVKAFANKNNYEYEIIKDIPLEYNHVEHLRVVSNYHRIDVLANNSDSIFFDWDVMLTDNFTLTLYNYPKFNSTGDNIIYSGDSVFWKNVRRLMGNIDDHKFELGRIFNILNRKEFQITPNMIIPNTEFEHLNYSKNKIQRSKRSKRL